METFNKGMKMIISFVTLLLICIVQLEASDGLFVQPDKVIYNKDSLLIEVALVDNPEKCLAEWDNPSFTYVPKVKTRTVFHRGEIVFPAITQPSHRK